MVVVVALVMVEVEVEIRGIHMIENNPRDPLICRYCKEHERIKRSCWKLLHMKHSQQQRFGHVATDKVAHSSNSSVRPVMMTAEEFAQYTQFQGS